MLGVLGLDALEKLIHCYIFFKCLNRTLAMLGVLGLDTLGKLMHCYN